MSMGSDMCAQRQPVAHSVGRGANQRQVKAALGGFLTCREPDTGERKFLLFGVCEGQIASVTAPDFGQRECRCAPRISAPRQGVPCAHTQPVAVVFHFVELVRSIGDDGCFCGKTKLKDASTDIRGSFFDWR
jgi:hypothetical protein